MAKEGMSRTTKVIVWVGVLATVGVTGVVAVKLYQRYKDRKDAEKNGDVAAAETGKDAGIISTIIGGTPTTCKHCIKTAAFPLKKGSQGKQVAAVQYAYNQKFPTKSQLTVDGDWGNATEKAFISLMGTSSANGWYNFSWGEALSYLPSVATGTYLPSGAGAGAGSAGSTATKQGLSISKTAYDKFFKGFENY